MRKFFFEDGKKIEFSLLSQYLDDFADVSSKAIKDLENYKRVGKCHIGSILTSAILKDKNYVVSGYTNNLGRYLHSWIEADIGKKEVVMDYVMNAIMNKEGYYYLKNPIEINRIHQSTIIKDRKNMILAKIGEIGLGDKEYVFFRDEILKDMERELKDSGR